MARRNRPTPDYDLVVVPATSRVEYTLCFALEDGRVWRTTYAPNAPRPVGSVFNFPIRPDGQSRAGKGYIWRVASIDENGELLLQFEGRHPGQEDDDYPPAR